MKTRISRYLTLLGLAFAIALIGAPSVFAQTLRDQMEVHFNRAVKVPGAVLQPGDYVFQLEPSLTNRHTVHIYREYSNEALKLVATAETDRIERAKVTKGNVVTAYKGPAGDPTVLDAWFMPGRHVGRRFIYGKQEAIRLARLNAETIVHRNNGYMGVRSR